MKQKPSFQFYPQDFLGSIDVQTMTAEEVGCYILLLLNCYNNGGQIPAEPASLKMLCRGIDPSKKVLGKFYISGDFLKQKRIDVELKKQAKFSKQQSQNAKKRWDSRGEDGMPSHSHRIDSASIRQCSSSSSSSSSPSLPNPSLLENRDTTTSANPPPPPPNPHSALYVKDLISKLEDSTNKRGATFVPSNFDLREMTSLFTAVMKTSEDATEAHKKIRLTIEQLDEVDFWKDKVFSPADLKRNYPKINEAIKTKPKEYLINGKVYYDID